MDRARTATALVRSALLVVALAIAPSARAGTYDLWDVDVSAAFPNAANIGLVDANAHGQLVGIVIDSAGIEGRSSASSTPTPACPRSSASTMPPVATPR